MDNPGLQGERRPGRSQTAGHRLIGGRAVKNIAEGRSRSARQLENRNVGHGVAVERELDELPQFVALVLKHRSGGPSAVLAGRVHHDGAVAEHDVRVVVGVERDRRDLARALHAGLDFVEGADIFRLPRPAFAPGMAHGACGPASDGDVGDVRLAL